MTGVGIDLLEIGRMQAALDRRPGLAARLFTPGERAAAAAGARPAQHLAARFCAKEAVVKALKLDSWDPHEIEVVGGGKGPPAIRVSGKVQEVVTERGLCIEISLTHSRDTAAAVAVALPAALAAACPSAAAAAAAPPSAVAGTQP